MTLTRRALSLASLGLALAGCTTTATTTIPNSVLVAGASGQTGKLVVEQLVAEGYAVRALVREPGKVAGLFPASAQLMAGDVKDPASLQRAMAGMTYVISAIGAKSGKGPDRPEVIDYAGVKNLAEAAREAKVRQFVLVSSRGVTQEDNPLNKLFGDVLKWKLKGEDALRASGVPYTVVRPGGLTNDPGRRQTISFEQGDRRGDETSISRADVADVCVQALKYPEARNRTFETSARDGPPTTNWRELFAGLDEG
jgi:uncharacterized protein YbjT (DUF2867 family)